METRRNTPGDAVGALLPAIRLAFVVSVVAVVAATILHGLGFSQPVLVLATIVVAFATSWVRTGQVVERRVASVPTGHARRQVTVPMHRVVPSRF